jgi:hypothetical protein
MLMNTSYETFINRLKTVPSMFPAFPGLWRFGHSPNNPEVEIALTSEFDFPPDGCLPPETIRPEDLVARFIVFEDRGNHAFAAQSDWFDVDELPRGKGVESWLLIQTEEEAVAEVKELRAQLDRSLRRAYFLAGLDLP